MGEQKRLRVVIHGRVQGVFFRQNTQRKAVELRVFGWVKNRFDDSVEAVFEGEQKSLVSILSFLKQNPGLSSVEKIVEEWEDSNNEFKDFKILY
ncbi:acylphosphatase [Candidatus Woesearchaeota archaeon]|nr:acylphosphatase [Candidatus Woesearchaeota archaeon]